MTDLNNILDRAATLKKIDSIKGRSSTLRADIQLCAVSAFIHAAEHGDLTLASKLHNAVSSSYRADLKAYFRAFGPVRWDVKSSQFTKAKKGGNWDVDGALATPFDSVPHAERTPADYDHNKALTAVVAFLDKAASNAVNNGDAPLCDALVDIAGILSRLVGVDQ